MALYERSPADGPLRQSELISGITQWVLSLQSVGTQEPELVVIEHPYSMIASQDCDLEQDFNGRQAGKPSDLASIFFYQVTPAVDLLARLSSSEIKKRVVNNKDERYHVLEAVPTELDALNEGIEAMGIDFKRYFSIPTEEVYKQLVVAAARRRSIMLSPYLEHFSVRASGFQCRVALPVDHQVDPRAKI